MAKLMDLEATNALFSKLFILVCSVELNVGLKAAITVIKVNVSVKFLIIKIKTL